MAMDSEWGDWIALWGLVKTVTMNICVIDEDCVIGRWYKLDFELMSLCPHFFFVYNLYVQLLYRSFFAL